MSTTKKQKPVRLLVTKKPKRKGECSCDKPTTEIGSLPAMDGEHLNFEYCSECMEVIKWVKEAEPVLKSQAIVTQCMPSVWLAVGEVITGKDEVPGPDVTEINDTPKVSEDKVKQEPQEDPFKDLKNKVSEAKDPHEGKFKITQVTPVQGKPDCMNFVCQHNGRFFVVFVPSTEEKVTKALINPARLVNKIATLRYLELDGAGMPVDAKVVDVKPETISAPAS